MIELSEEQVQQQLETPVPVELNLTPTQWVAKIGRRVQAVKHPTDRLKLATALMRVAVIEILKHNMPPDMDQVRNYVQQFDQHTGTFMARVRKEMAPKKSFKEQRAEAKQAKAQMKKTVEAVILSQMSGIKHEPIAPVLSGQ